MITTLVTGANGFVGSFLVERLVKEGFDVRCFVLRGSDLRWIKNLPVKIYFGDLTKPETLIEPLKDVEYVFHLAAKKHAFTKDEYYSANYLATLNLLEACKQAGSVKKFVHISAQAVVGPNPTKEPLTEETPCKPIEHYGKSKLKGEEEVRKYQSVFPVVIIRPATIYGPRNLDFLPIVDFVKWGIKPRFGFKEKHVNLIYIDDLIEAIFKVSQSEKASGKTYFVCNKMIYSSNELIDEVFQKLNKRAISTIIPNSLLYISGFINEVVTRIMGKQLSSLNRRMALELAQENWLISSQKIEDELGFVAKTSLSEGISRSIEWFKANGYL